MCLRAGEVTEIMARQTVRMSALSLALYRQEMYFSYKMKPQESSQPASSLFQNAVLPRSFLHRNRAAATKHLSSHRNKRKLQYQKASTIKKT